MKLLQEYIAMSCVFTDEALVSFYFPFFYQLFPFHITFTTSCNRKNTFVGNFLCESYDTPQNLSVVIQRLTQGGLPWSLFKCSQGYLFPYPHLHRMDTKFPLCQCNEGLLWQSDGWPGSVPCEQRIHGTMKYVV